MSTLHFRLVLAMLFTALLVLLLWQVRGSQVRAISETDPNVIWSIGRVDGLSDEFAAGTVPTLTYVVGRSSPGKDWRSRQSSDDGHPSTYTVRFNLDHPPAAAELDIDLYFVGPAPSGAEILVNGKRGVFRIRPGSGPFDAEMPNPITYTRQSLRVPVPGSRLQPGENEIGISFRGKGGEARYDCLALRKATAGEPELAATVEPTIFYKRDGEQLREVTEVVVKHQRPLGKMAVSLRAGAAQVSRACQGADDDFGERVIELDVPALPRATPYELTVKEGGQITRFHGEFRPEKRWRIFAGLKIHNDIGYTDLQPHVQELDNRNTDTVIDIISRFPFYKFNFETTWLIENYLQSRKAPRTRELMALAARNQVGINALYLNLMTGLCTGEELYRSLYYSHTLHKQYGMPMKFACLTDAPSHSWFLPTLLADTGVEGFALGSNQVRAPLLKNGNLNEESPFYWEGADGRRIMAWFARGYMQFTQLAGDNPSVEHLRRTVHQFLARYRRASYPVDAVLLYGLYADNASIRDGDTTILKAWNQAYEFPKIIPATDADYYAYLSKNFAGKLPTYRGDAGAYWEDGVGSSALETAKNRDSQRLLPVAEMASALASAFDPMQAPPTAEFREAWKNLLFFDEHTWGAAGSVGQPDRTSVKDQWEFKSAYGWRAHWAAKDLFFRSLNRLVQNISTEGPALFVFNWDLWPRSDAVQIDISLSQSVFDAASGEAIPLQVISQKRNYRTVRFVAGNVPAFGYKAFSVRRTEASSTPPVTPSPDSWRIESRYYRVEVDPATGAISQLVDKELGRNLADGSSPYKLNELLYVAGGEKSRILQNAVTMPPPQLEITGQSGVRLVERYPDRIIVRARSKNVPEIEIEIRVYNGIKRIDIVNRIRKDEVRSKEAVYFAFPFRVSPPELLYEVQNAFVRPNEDQLPGANREWFATQNLIVARDPGVTIAWTTPDAPLVTLTDINRGLWPKHLTIKNGHVFSYVMNNYWFTNYKASQGGEFTFRYSITSRQNFSDAELARFSAEIRSPLVAYDYYNSGDSRLKPAKRRMPPAQGAFFQIDAPQAQMTAFKQAEDGNGFILRLREISGHKGVARFQSPIFPLASVQLCNGVEDNLSPLVIGKNGVEIPLKPHAFSTVRLVFANAIRSH